MRKHHCIQLAFVVLLIVPAFPHQYQTQDPTDDDDNERNSAQTTTEYKDSLDQSHQLKYNLRKTSLTLKTHHDQDTAEEGPVDAITTDTANSTSHFQKKSQPDLETSSSISERSESGRRDEEQTEAVSGNLSLSSADGDAKSLTDSFEIPYQTDYTTKGEEALKELGSDFSGDPVKISDGQETAAAARRTTSGESRNLDGPEQREIDSAVEYGLRRMQDLYFVKEPELYRMGLFLERNHPGYILASFRAPSEKALHYARYGYATIQARTKLAEIHPESISRESPAAVATLRSGILRDECPLQGIPRCPPGFERYRTSDGTCNNFQNPWWGASMLPMQRFLPPQYDDGIQSVRRSVLGAKLPSPRDISTRIHRDNNREMQSVTLMFMQWGQFLDHDITSSAQARMFNRSVPQCCEEGGVDFLPPELTHPECLPMSVSPNDWFLSQFGVHCIEFVRSAPTSRIDCDLGWREQISQATAYIDASTVYGSDPEMADSLRLFRKGQLLYGRSQRQGPLQPPDPPGGELCRMGAITTDCFQGGDSRIGDQPGLTALHTVWLRYHNRIALRLGSLNPHWSDEKIYQESRRIVAALVQHITYREFLPIVLGQEVMKLFDLDLVQTGYYKAYSPKVNPAPANSFGTAAFRFGHSLVQHSFVRTDTKHRIIPNNVSLHEEQENVENIWSFGSLDRLILGLCDQPSQRRDEFISDELTNHLFQSSNFPFGMDLAAINIQRGRDHGVPSYTSWREPCGLIPLSNWTDLEKVMSTETVRRFRSLYAHIDDIDLFSGGLSEKPVRGGIVGPTFACIIAQQFSNLRKGDRFWYENNNFESSFTPAQLQQIRSVTFAHVLCNTLKEVETLQPFVFLSADSFRNARASCSNMNNLDLNAWSEKVPEKPLFNHFLRKSFRSNNFSSEDVATASKNQEDVPSEEYDYDDVSKENEDTESRQRPKKKRVKVKPTASRKKTTTKATVTRLKRPTMYVNNRPVDGQTYKPFRIKLTNVSTTTLTFNKYGRPTNTIKTRPIMIHNGPATDVLTNKRPYYATDAYYQGNYEEPTKRPFLIKKPTVDGYLIQYPSGSPNLNTARPNTIKTQGSGSAPYHVNINIQFMPSDGQIQNNDKFHSQEYNGDEHDTGSKRTKRPTNRPVFLLDNHDQEDYYIKRPSNYGPYNNNGQFVTKRPSYSYSRPNNGYDGFLSVAELTSTRPVYRPSVNHDTVFEDMPFATSSRPQYSYDNFQHKISTMKPVIIPSYLYLNEQETQVNYDSYQQMDRPIYNRRPANLYKTDDSDDDEHGINSDFNPEYKLDIINVKPVAYKRRKGTATTTEDKSDSLTDSKTTDHDKDDNFIKISSVQGHTYTTEEEMKRPMYISVQQREDSIELPNSNENSKDSPLIQVDVVPSEIRMEQWKVYNETGDVVPVLPIFDLLDVATNVSCSSELPQPIKFNATQSSASDITVSA